MSTLRVALAQANFTVGDIPGNLARIAAAISDAKDAGADLVAFPELAVSGYPPEDLLHRPQFLRSCSDAVADIAKETTGIVAIVGSPVADGGSVFNAAAVVAEGRLGGVHRKIELPNYGVFDEKRYFSPGASPLIFTVQNVRVGLSICEDAWVDGGQVEQSLAAAQPDIVINIAASPFYAGKHRVRDRNLARFARRTASTLCYVNMVGGQDELVFDGGTLALSAEGKVVGSAPRFREHLFILDMVIPGKERRDPAGKGILSVQLDQPGPRKSIQAERHDDLGELEEVHAALELGTRDYVRKNGFGGVLIGLSGGIDSALTAAVAVEAIGADNVTGVTMPSRFTSSDTRSDAELLASNLGIDLLSIPIEPVYAAYLDVLEEDLGEPGTGVAFQNLQARIRGNILMALSNRTGQLVLTTGNKSETAVGYSTLYGDTAGGFAMIKDVPKTLVYRLSEHINTSSGREIIPRSVIDRPPTAELKPDQKDEDSLPPYELLDPILELYVENDMSPEEIAEAGHDLDMAMEVVGMVDRNEYKRRQAPPGIKITPRAFGRDRRLPITNLYQSRERNPVFFD